jgi:hypothetical protein
MTAAAAAWSSITKRKQRHLSSSPSPLCPYWSGTYHVTKSKTRFSIVLSRSVWWNSCSTESREEKFKIPSAVLGVKSTLAVALGYAYVYVSVWVCVYLCLNYVYICVCMCMCMCLCVCIWERFRYNVYMCVKDTMLKNGKQRKVR